jgi:hypothetical protein
MQFQVPQFIETEEKIIGPLTLKQFFFLAGAGAISFLCFYIFKFWLWLIITGILGTVAFSLAFIKYHGRPLPVIVMAAFEYFWKPRFYLWKKTEEKIKYPEIKAPSLKKEEGAPAFKNLWLRLTTSNQPISKAEKKPFSLISKEAVKKEKFEVFRKITGEREAARRVDYR